jgi:choline dehydrogenase-like flavoprotein
MFHNSQAVLAISKERNPTIFQKTLGVNDFYFASDEWEFPMGNVQMVGKSVPEMYRGERPTLTKLAPFGLTLKEVAEHAIDFWLSTEDLPQPQNRVSLDAEGNVVLRYKPSNDEARDRLLKQLRSMLGHLGMSEHHLFPRWAYMENKIPVAGVAHQAGTCRFGSDPGSSVLNPDCRAHELDNLYVVDTSFFPSISAVNPALTAMANAVRVGEHLVLRLGGTPAGVQEASGGS